MSRYVPGEISEVPSSDYGGHTWERCYREDGEPLLAMKCAGCGKVWSPSQTLRQLGRCPTPITPILSTTSGLGDA